jgi:hypothetical protein
MRDPAIPEPPPRNYGERPPSGRGPSIVRGTRFIDSDLYDEPPADVPRGPFRRSLDPPSIAESDFWDHCVREFVALQSDPGRRALNALVARYATSCDATGRVVLERPLGADGRARQAKFDIALVGTMSVRRVELSLRLTLCEQRDVDRASIGVRHASGADGALWTSNRLEVERNDQGCAIAEIPLTRTLALALRSSSEAADAWVGFECGKHVETVRISDEQKQDLALVLDAYDAVR